MDTSLGSSRKWKDKIVWQACDKLFATGLDIQEITDTRLVEALKAEGHAAGNPNQRLKYLREWKAYQRKQFQESLLTKEELSVGDSYDRDENEVHVDKPKPHSIYTVEIETLKGQLLEALSKIEKAEDKNGVLEESLSATTHQLGELRDRAKTLEYELGAAKKENEQIQVQLHASQAQYKNVELLLNRITEANENLYREKLTVVRSELEGELHTLRTTCHSQEQTIQETTEKLNRLEQDFGKVEKEYLSLKADADNWEGEKKRLQIELAKARSKQFLNEFSQFTQGYQNFVQKFLTESQHQTHGYVNQCFERMYALVQFELKQAKKHGTVSSHAQISKPPMTASVVPSEAIEEERDPLGDEAEY